MAEYNEPSNPRIDENQSSTPPLPLKIKYLIGILSVSTVGLLASTIALAKVQTENFALVGAQPVPTEGVCKIDVSLQAKGSSPVGIPTNWHPEDNIIARLAGSTCTGVAVSPTWSIAGWDYTIVEIAPTAIYVPPAVSDEERQLVKIMRGSLIDVNVNGVFDGIKWETFTVTTPNRAIPFYIDNSVNEIQAGAEGAVIVYMKVTEATLSTPITDMASSPVSDIQGPFKENLKWNKFSDITPPDWGFEGVEFYNLAGILMQNNDGSRFANLQFWTFREDFNADNYHDHSDLDSTNTFGEIHMMMYSANNVGGMQTTLSGTENLNWVQNPEDTGIGNSFNKNNETEIQIAIPMPPGYGHGPLWSVDPVTGEPTRLCSGGIQYPPHRMLTQANGPPHSPPRYQMWVAFEHLPEDVTVPLKMLTEWPNAYLQSNLPEADCTAQAAAANLNLELPTLLDNLCDYDTIYDSISTGNVVEVNLRVRYRDCPNNNVNQPCRATNPDPNQGNAEGPMLNGVRSDHAIVINDGIPGPEIRAKLGDTIRVNVENLLGVPTTMHFHGMTQFRTPFMDGDEMVSNCPIQPGYSHTYEFVAHPAGTTFYHSHSGSQRVSGMTGPLIVEDQDEPFADAPDRLVFIQDWYNQNADSNFDFWGQNTPGDNCITFGGNHFTGEMNKNNGIGPVAGDGIVFQSFIINGHGVYQYGETQIPDANFTFQDLLCPGQSATAPRCEYCLNKEDWTGALCTESSADVDCGQPNTIEVYAGVETRLRFIHAGALFASQVCIDGHGIDIITADGGAIEPYQTDCFIIYPAERYDAMIMPKAVGDYLIRFTTLEQGTNGHYSGTGPLPNNYTPGFPHYGYAILRVKNTATNAQPQYLSDYSPITCDSDTTVNCGPGYWFTSKTMGCAAGPSRMFPERCVTAFAALKSAEQSSPNSDVAVCADKKMPHEVDATVKATLALGFLPDQVPRWEGISLNARIEVLMEEDFGFPFITPDDTAEWVPHQPISFVNPNMPPLSLSPDERAEIYARTAVFRELNKTSTVQSFPNYPVNFSRGLVGQNAIMTSYGDVVRIYFSCAEPYGPGCAMPHPMHLHGMKMAVLYSGEWTEEYDESKFNPNPIYRDTVTVNTDQFTVVQFAATNPGVWRLHCHVNIHHRGGMAVLVDVGGDSSVEAVRATPDSVNLCPKRANPPVETSHLLR